MAIAPIEVEVKSVYGTSLIYPDNEPARILARIAGKKTLSMSDLRNASALGLEVRRVFKENDAIMFTKELDLA